MSDLGISNFEIEKIIKSSNNEDPINNFVSAFSSDKMNKFIDFHRIMKRRLAKNLFLLSNTDRVGNTEKHSWEILDIRPKTEYFFLFFWS